MRARTTLGVVVNLLIVFALAQPAHSPQALDYAAVPPFTASVIGDSTLPAEVNPLVEIPIPPTTTTTQPANVNHQAVSQTSRFSSSHHGYSSVEECISMVENHGLYDRSSNPTHFGRYQFDMNSWVTFGGNPDDWGTASPEEQDRVFANAMAAQAYSRWTPYDGC